MVKLFIVEHPEDYAVFVPFHNIAGIRKLTNNNNSITQVFLKYGIGDGNKRELRCRNDFEVLTMQITEDLRDKRF